MQLCVDSAGMGGIVSTSDESGSETAREAPKSRAPKERVPAYVPQNWLYVAPKSHVAGAGSTCSREGSLLWSRGGQRQTTGARGEESAHKDEVVTSEAGDGL